MSEMKSRPRSGSGGLFVGLGASAGSLEALQQFFPSVPADSGNVYVVVQHLERHHPSMLSALLGRATRMPVAQAEDGVSPQPDRVYVIPPNSVLTLERGVLRVARPAETGLRSPIDAFFRSLAAEQGENAVGIVLSGAGSDGTAGLRAIKEHGGLTLAQPPETAKFDSMPLSAISAGLVDDTLPVEEMAGRIKAYAEGLAEIRRRGSDELDTQVASAIGAICEIIQRATGHDFSRYRQGTLVRRVRRRMQVHRFGSVADYVRHLDEDSPEAHELLRDLLIGVTHFFRDPEVFKALAEQALPTILASGDPSAAVRIWVPGCASGEEAYSIAILVLEHLAREGTTRAVKIFATDIDEELLAVARQGRYPENILQQVSPERLERFFTREGDRYQVGGELREMCTFSAHSLIKDPPFSSLDLISCRNVFIYLGPDLQKRLLPLFHYALRAGSYLLLGPSESPAASGDLFLPVDAKHRLFQRREVLVRPPIDFPLTNRRASRVVLQPTLHETAALAPAHVFSHAFDRMVLEEYAAPCAVVNERGDILYVAGRIGRYLQVPAGAPTNNALTMAQGGLRAELRSALGRAAATNRKVVRGNLTVELDGRQQRLRLTVRPLPGVAREAGLYALVLQATGAAEDELEVEDAAPESEQSLIEQLENELRTTRSDLQAALEELESSNEELKSVNEELVSSNEELQSTNEELHSSKEELQSTNDELIAKVHELDALQTALQQHLSGIQIASIFLDRDLRIIHFTPLATKVFNLVEGDVGRPLRDLAPRFVEEDLLPSIEAVLARQIAVERHVHTVDDTWYLVRILPYREQGDAAAGVGVTLVDITDLRRAEDAERRYRSLRDPLFTWSRDDGGIETWNDGARRLYGFDPEEAKGAVARDLLHEGLPCPWPDVEGALRTRGQWEGEIDARTKGGLTVTVLATLSLMRDSSGRQLVLQSERDVTERKAVERERERLMEALRAMDRSRVEFLATLSHELRNPLAPIRSALYILDHAMEAEAVERAKAVIGRQVGQLARLVDDLLDIARLSRGKISLRLERLDLGALVHQVVEDHRALLAGAGLALDVDIPPQPLWVDGDAARLMQSIGNLLHNASKFTPRGGHVQVAAIENSARHEVEILVRDDGTGIQPELLTKLFNPFEQADRTLARSQGGLGLGLALVKRLIEQHGGNVEAQSEGSGKGTVFTIRLPLRTEPAADGATTVSAPPISRRVLIIEDNVDAGDSLRDALALSGHDVELARDGREGIAKARAFSPEVVLCDIGMPGMDGYEVARELRADPALSAVLLVALTGYALPEDLSRAADAGFDQHLSKPPAIEALAEALNKLPTTMKRGG